MLVQYHIWRIGHNTMLSIGNKSPIRGPDVAQVYIFTVYFQWGKYDVHSESSKLSYNLKYYRMRLSKVCSTFNRLSSEP